MADTFYTFSTSSEEVTISEKALLDQLIYRVRVQKPDKTLVTCNIDQTKTSQAARDVFQVDPITAEVRIKDPTKLDYESVQQYELYLFLRSFSNLLAGDFTTFKLVIKIRDVNDNSPMFNQQAYTFSIIETSAANTPVGTVRATDADGDVKNNQVTYFISNAVLNDVFSINRLTGQITLTGSLDYKLRKEYVKVICASDSATDANEVQPAQEKRSACIPVVVKVLKVNNNLPTFKTKRATVKISEKAPDGLEVYRFSAQDDDEAQIYYEYNVVKTSSADMASFQINNITGMVTLAATKLDFEMRSVYTLYVKAIDSSSLAVGDEAELRIDVIDMNDNSPVFKRNLIDVSMYENATVGTFVETVSASDQDGVSAGKLRYYIVQNQYSALFSIDAPSGVIRLASTLDYEGQFKRFVLTVCATDSAIDPRQNVPGMSHLKSCIFYRLIFSIGV